MRIGIYCPSLAGTGGEEKGSAVVAERLARRHEVVLFARDSSVVPRARRDYGADLSRVRIVELGEPGPVVRAIRRFGSRFRWRALWLEGRRHAERLRENPVDVFLNFLGGSHLRSPAPIGIYRCLFPQRLAEDDAGPSSSARAITRLLGRPWAASFDARLDSYGTIVAISDFTAGWIGRLWGRPSRLIYDAASDMGPPAEKARVILSVGSFGISRSGEIGKRQDVLIDAFRRLDDLHANGWRLVLAGSVVRRDRGDRALAALRVQARGLPVDFHPDVAADELRDLYRRSTLYWHAMGYGFDPETQPSRQEHYGITVIEAMSAGAVPLVLGQAGPADTVVDGVSGVHWRTLEDLGGATRALAADEAKRRMMAEAAMSRSRLFLGDAFASAYEALVDELGASRQR